MKPKEVKQLTYTLKAIADPTRRAIFDLILNSTKKESISSVTKEFKMTRQGVTKHLKILELGGLVLLKRIGRVTYCYAEKEPLKRVQTWIEQFLDAQIVTDELVSKETSEQLDKLVKNTQELLTEVENTEKELNENGAEKSTILVQMSIDPNDPGQPVIIEPVKVEPNKKEPKEKPIEVTDNQLDIYGIRKEPKVNEDSQLEMF